MVEARSNVVASDSVDCKGFTSISRFMGEDFYAGWSKRCFVIVEVAMDLRMGGELWIDSTWSKEIEGQDCLWEQFVLKV